MSRDYEEIISRWVPGSGEGQNAGSQAATAVNKLIYKWFNDGDVFDNTYHLEGWYNDLSSYANWLAEYVDGCEEILMRISKIVDDEGYRQLLQDLADHVLTDEFLNELVKRYTGSTTGSIYDCSGPFVFIEP